MGPRGPGACNSVRLRFASTGGCPEPRRPGALDAPAANVVRPSAESDRRGRGPESRPDPGRLHAVRRPPAVRMSARPIPVPVLCMGGGPLRLRPVHLHAMRTHGLILRPGALRDVVNHRGEVVGFNLNTNVPQGRRRREIHDADKSRLLAQTHGRPVTAATRQELAPRGIPDSLGPNLLSKAIEAVSEPDYPIRGRLQPQIGGKG